MKDKKLQLTPRKAMAHKKLRMIPVVKLCGNAAKDGLRERLRRFSKPAGS